MKLKVVIFSLLCLLSVVSIAADEAGDDHGAATGAGHQATGTDATSVNKANKCYLGRPGETGAQGPAGDKGAKGPAGAKPAAGGAQVDLSKKAKCMSCHGVDPKAPVSTSLAQAQEAVSAGRMPKGNKVSEAEKAAILATLK